ncbi:MAG: hypothetical protein CBB65_15855 [Hyphomonadaceae bacterium TMED5]|nr:MAG: hypothetical protein CBB65_15855 [Hyphomonadaceae bacterium TMED5]
MLNTLPISEQAIDDFLPVMQNNAQNSREEEGNITFEVFMNEDGSSTIYLFEEWESAEALEEHMETPHLQAVAAVVGDAFVEGQRETSLRLNRLTDDTPPAPVSTPGRNAKCSGHFRCEA